jgi:hypothetical protein
LTGRIFLSIFGKIENIMRTEMQSDTENKNRIKSPNLDIIGFTMVVFPLFTSILQWYLFLFFDFAAKEGVYFLSLIFGTVFFTTVMATVDSHRLGIKVKIYKRKEIYGGSFLKFFIFILLWPYAYPVYIYRRKYYGSRSLVFPLVFSVIIFVVSSAYLHLAIDAKQTFEESIQRRKLQHRNLR